MRNITKAEFDALTTTIMESPAFQSLSEDDFYKLNCKIEKIRKQRGPGETWGKRFYDAMLILGIVAMTKRVL